MISSDDALFGHPAFRYVGWAPRMWPWAMIMGLRKFQEMVFTGRPFTAEEMYDCNFVNSVVPRDQLEAEVEKYALACAAHPADRHGVHAEGVLRDHEAAPGRVHGQPAQRLARIDGRPLRDDDDGKRATLSKETMDAGLNLAVKDNDSAFPPEWRLSRSGRRRPNRLK